MTGQTFGLLKLQKVLSKEGAIEASGRDEATETENKATTVIMAITAIKEGLVREITQEQMPETVREDIVMVVVQYHMELEALEEGKIFIVGIEWPIGM